MTKHPIPDEVLIDHLAVLGKTGAGKTFAGKGIVERLLAQKRRVCIVDPKNAWWGLKSSADGKSPAFSVVVFGGPKADVPLLANHGKVLGEAVATTHLSCIICTKEMPERERIQFLTDFFQTLNIKNNEPLHLILDEAHMMAPQKPLGEMQRLTHWTSELVSGGRGMGFRVMLLSQRPARLNKDVLTQCESLVAMRMTGPQDRDAVRNWIHDQADMETGKEIVASLPTLQNGEGWFWAPAKDILKRVKFPLITTYDNSKTKRDSKADDRAELAPVDLTALQDKLGKVKIEIDANDPAKLRARVADLEKQLRAKPTAVSVVDPKAADQSYKSGYDTGYQHGLVKGAASVNSVWMKWRTVASTKAQSAGVMFEKLTPLMHDAYNALGTPPVMPEGPANGTAPPPPRAVAAPKPVAITPALVGQKIGDSGLPGQQQRIIDSVAWWNAAGIAEPCREQVAFAADYKSSGGGYFKNQIGALVTNGYVRYPRPGFVALTEQGTARANSPGEAPSTEALHKRVRNLLPGQQQRIFDAIVMSYPNDMTRDEVAAQAKYDGANGGYFKNQMGALRTIGIAEYPQPGVVRAAEWLFLE